MLRNRQTVERVLQYKEQHPEEAQQLFKKVVAFAEERKKEKISVISVAKKYPFPNGLWKLAVLLLSLPYYLASAVVNLPVWLTTWLIRRNLKDPAFGNTVSYAVRLVLFPIIFIAGTAVLFCNLPWYWALGGTVLLSFSYSIFVDYNELLRRCLSDLRWPFKKILRSQFESLNLKRMF